MGRVEGQVSATRPDRSVLLSASAGSGKTRVLVRRMIHLLAAGVDPGRLAAITFTEKAAAQMKDRLYGELLRAAWDNISAKDLLELGPGDMPYPLTKTPEDIFSCLTARPDALQVSTVHAFCLKLLRQFPLEAGLPAGFSVMDEAEIPIRRELAVDGCMEAVRDSGLEGELRTLMDGGMTLPAVKGLLLLALDKRGQIRRLEMDSGGFDRLIRKLEEKLDGASKTRAAEDMLGDGGLRGMAEGLSALLKGNGLGDEDYVTAIEGLAETRGLDELPEIFGHLRGYFYTKASPVSYKKRTPVSNDDAASAIRATYPSLKGKLLKEKAAELKGRHDALFVPVREKLNTLAGLYDYIKAGEALTAFLKLYYSAEEIYTAINRREGYVDYDDLEIHAYRLLTCPDSDAVLARVEAKVLHYLVDEFQDTGAVQWGIIERLNSEAFAGQGAEGLMSPTLFAVGDKKQSIYRFRKADYRLMGTLKTKMEEQIEPEGRDFPELVHNFRSAPEIVRVVDETFGKLWDGYRPSEVFRKGARGSVTLRITDTKDEAEALADEIQGALGLALWDDEKGGFRPADYGDMAVLLRSRTGLMAYEEAMRRRGIRFKVTGGVGFFFQEEVQAALGILSFLENPSDLLSLSIALKSPLFRISDGDIEPVYKAPDVMAALAEANPEAYGLIKSWRGKAGATGLGRLVEEIVRDSGALFAFGITLGPAAALNIEKLVGIARDFDRKGGVGLSEFTGWVKAYREKAELPTADLELPGFERFVSIMTVHAAKGLEFPVVLLPGVARRPRTNVDGFLIGEGECGFRAAIKTEALLGDNPQYAVLKEEEDRERVEEARRLMYVAMTRAKDHLVMLAGVKDGSKEAPKESWLGFLREARPEVLFKDITGPGLTPGSYRYPDEVMIRLEPRAEEVSFKGVEINGTLSLNERLSPLPEAPGTGFVAPHGLAGGLPDEDEAPGPYPAMLRGVLIHAMLESLGRYGKYDVRSAANRTAGFAALDKQSGDALMSDAEKMVKGLLEDGGIKDLLSPGEGKYPELPLLLKRGGEVISGFADLVIIDGDMARVVDYKTGLAGVPLDDIKNAYLPQLSAYCEAVKEAFGIREAAPYLLLVDRKKIVPLSS